MTWQEAWFDDHLACPYDQAPLRSVGTERACESGHRFPVVHGVPVLLRSDVDPTHHVWRTRAEDLAKYAHPDVAQPSGEAIDPFVQRWLIATCGQLYRHCRLPLPRYPIPDIELPESKTDVLLDVGANWGRWSLAATRRGYRAVALDPSLEAALAGLRVSRQLGLPVAYVVGDARHLPFRSDSFDVGFSYSVLQHLDKEVVRSALVEMSRVTRTNGTIQVQMANCLGARRLSQHLSEVVRGSYQQLVGRGRPPYGFRVRPWTPWELLATFRALVGPSRLSVDGFFSLDAQMSDLDLLPPFSALVVLVSHGLRELSRRFPIVVPLADSIWVRSQNGG